MILTGCSPVRHATSLLAWVILSKQWMRMDNGKAKRNDKQLLWRIHHWAGLYAGIVIGMLSLTGALAVFIPEIDALILKHRYHARSSAEITGDPQFGKAVDSLTNQFPEYNSLAIHLPEESDQVAQVD